MEGAAEPAGQAGSGRLKGKKKVISGLGVEGLTGVSTERGEGYKYGPSAGSLMACAQPAGTLSRDHCGQSGGEEYTLRSLRPWFIISTLPPTNDLE